jgi:hypothetical protein
VNVGDDSILCDPFAMKAAPYKDSRQDTLLFMLSMRSTRAARGEIYFSHDERLRSAGGFASPPTSSPASRAVVVCPLPWATV